jgi:heat shock protein HslJ
MMDRPTLPPRSGRAALRGLALAIAAGMISTAMASERGFPFDRELFLDSGPIGKSRKIPSLEVSAGGQAQIELYCASGQGQVTIAADAMTIVPGPMVEQQCTPDRLRGDDDLMAALAAVTAWRREGESIVLIGTRTLRYRPATN